MNTKLGLTIFALIAVPLGSGCFVIPQDAIDDIKEEIPQSKNTLQINALADGSGKTRVTACVADPIVCRNADGPFTAMLDTGAAVEMPFVVDFTEPDGSKVGRFQGSVGGDTPESTLDSDFTCSGCNYRTNGRRHAIFGDGPNQIDLGFKRRNRSNGMGRIGRMQHRTGRSQPDDDSRQWRSCD
jgi:hypothetical protein